MKSTKIGITLSILLILSVLIPSAKVKADWYVGMSTTVDKSGYETVKAKDTVYGALYDTVAVFEGLTSKTKVLSIKSDNASIKAKANCYTDNGEELYSILAYCSNSKKTQEKATITVECYSINKNKNYTRKLYVSFSKNYNYNLADSTSLQIGESKDLSIARTSSIESQDISYGELRRYRFAFDHYNNPIVCSAVLSKENGTLSITANEIGCTNLELTTNYISGEVIHNDIDVKVADNNGCILVKNKKLVMGEKIFNVFNSLNKNAIITVTNSNPSVVKYHTQTRTAKQVANAYKYKLSKHDDPTVKNTLIYFEGLKEGNSTVYITYTLKENGKQTTYKYRYNIEVVNKSKKETKQPFTSVYYDNTYLYHDPCYLRDTSGNILQGWGKATSSVRDFMGYYSPDDYIDYSENTIDTKNVTITVTVRDLDNKPLSSFTKTFTTDKREEKESSDIIVNTEEQANEYFGNKSWYSKQSDCFSFFENKIGTFIADAGEPLSIEGTELSDDAVYSFDINKKAIIIKDGKFTAELPYVIVDAKKAIIKLNGTWKSFSLQ